MKTDEELKFRAWSRIGENMIYTGKCAGISIVSGKPMLTFEIQEPVSISFGEYELMQCTDMKDKNGADIYAGDLVRICEDDNMLAIIKKEDGEKCKLMRVINGICVYMERYYPCELEVVGNIYENPEMLGGIDNERRPHKATIPRQKKLTRWRAGTCRICGEWSSYISQDHARRHGYKNADEMAHADVMDWTE